MTELVLPKGTPVEIPAEPDAIPLYGDMNPGATADENWATFEGIGLSVRNVTFPTLTPVLPAEGKRTGAAVIVHPGGAFMMLAMEHEGWNVAKILAKRGIAAFVLKYRVLPTPSDEFEAGAFMAATMAGMLPAPGEMPNLRSPLSTADGRRALKLVRERAGEWGIDKERIGLAGFSAGAMNILDVTLTDDAELAPAFMGYFYGPSATVDVPTWAPPLFCAMAMDDQFFAPAGFPLAAAWNDAGRPVELHAYQDAPHGFGVGFEGATTSSTIDQFVAWLDMQGLN